MILNTLKTNLPWVAPSVAIVLAATGFFDRSDRGETPQQVVATQEVAPEQPQILEQNEVSQASNLATSFNSLSATGALNADVLENQGGVSPNTLELTPAAAVAAEPAAPVLQAVPDLSDDPVGFFAAAKANLEARASCVEDLRNLTGQARIYFPSGGLTAEQRGMSQARLIGVIAQDCPGVKIRVEGHSDPSGDPQVNLTLSQQRAEAIIARIAASGIDTSNFFAKGYGPAEPSNVTGPRPSSYYDRRVEFELIENTTQTASLGALTSLQRDASISACVAELEAAVQVTKVFFAPRSITSSHVDFSTALDLANKAAACPGARLRVVGQHSDQFGSGETGATGRLRAAAMMSALVGEGVDPGQIIINAPSWSQEVPGQPGLSNHRIDFDIILEDG